MAWVYLTDTFYDDPKVIAAGPMASWMYLCGLCYAAKHATRGDLPRAKVRTFLGQPSANKWTRYVQKLEQVGLWERTEFGWHIHNYEKWNREQISRSEAGRRAAEARWSRMRAHSAGNASAMREQCDAAMPSDALSPLIPSPVVDSPPPTYAVASHADDDDDEEEEEESLGNDQRIGQAVDLLARADLADRQAVAGRPPVADTVAWLAKARARRAEQSGAALTALAGEYPHATAADLADRLTPTTPSGERRDTRLDGQQAAMLAKANEGAEQIRRLRDVPVDPMAAERIRAIRNGARLPRAPTPDP